MQHLRRYENISVYLVRVVIAIIFFHHGADKTFNFDLVVEKYETMGFIGLLFSIVGIIEISAAVALLTDSRVRPAALLLSAIIAMAILTVQLPVALEGGLARTGALEREFLILASLWLIYVTGGGDTKLTPLHHEPETDEDTGAE